jgi:peroxiredoxin
MSTGILPAPGGQRQVDPRAGTSWGYLAGLLTIVALLIARSAGATVEPPQARLGDRAPDFSLQDEKGRWHPWTEFLGPHGMVVAFLAVNVINEARALVPLDAWLAERGVGLVGVDVTYKGKPVDSQASFEAAGLAFPILYDPKRLIAPLYGVERVPTVFLLDGELVVRYVGAIRGAADEPHLMDAVRAIIEGRPVPEPRTSVEGEMVRPLPKPRPPRPES